MALGQQPSVRFDRDICHRVRYFSGQIVLLCDLPVRTDTKPGPPCHGIRTPIIAFSSVLERCPARSAFQLRSLTISYCAEGPGVDSARACQKRQEAVQTPARVLPAHGHQVIWEEQALREACRPGVIHPGPGAVYRASDAEHPAGCPHLRRALDTHRLLSMVH